MYIIDKIFNVSKYINLDDILDILGKNKLQECASSNIEQSNKKLVAKNLQTEELIEKYKNTIEELEKNISKYINQIDIMKKKEEKNIKDINKNNNESIELLNKKLINQEDKYSKLEDKYSKLEEQYYKLQDTFCKSQDRFHKTEEYYLQQIKELRNINF